MTGQISKSTENKELLVALDETDQALRDGSYLKAIEALETALKLALPGDRPGIEHRLEDVHTRQAQAASAEDSWLDEELSEADPDLEACERAFGRLERADPYWPRLPTLRERLEQKRDEQREREAEAALRQELGKLWKSGRLYNAEEARRLARQAVGGRPGHPSWQRLEEEAEKQYEAVSALEQRATTAQVLKQYDTLETEVRNAYQAFDSIPNYRYDRQAGELIRDRYAPRDQLHRVLDQIALWASDSDTDIARRKLREAQSEMPANPHAALRYVKEGLEAKHASREALDPLTTYGQEVQRAVDKRDRVEAGLADTRRSPDVDAAWQNAVALKGEDPDAPSVAFVQPEAKLLRMAKT
jgi:hypothetical protein